MTRAWPPMQEERIAIATEKTAEHAYACLVYLRDLHQEALETNALLRALLDRRNEAKKK